MILKKETITFKEAFDRLMGHEGDYVNNPADPGGETKWGISKRSYPGLNIADLTRDDAAGIYLKDFWRPVALDGLPASVAFQLFDFAVNSGIGTAVRKLQATVGVADDGHWGPMSKAALETIGEEDLLLILTAERLEFMTKLKNWPNAGKGWARRIAQNLRYAADDNTPE